MIDDHRRPEQVRDTYDEIAPHFSKTRQYPWPEVEQFLDGRSAPGWGLAVGCGNGRQLVPLAAVTRRAVGVDVSRGLLVEARETVGTDPEDPSLIQGDARSLPIADDSVALALYVATIHHLPDRETRRESLAELARVLEGGGRALVSAWSTAHETFDAPGDAEEGFDTTVDWTLPGGETVPRFYHIYSPPEFEADLAASPLTVERASVSSGNCYARVRV